MIWRPQGRKEDNQDGGLVNQKKLKYPLLLRSIPRLDEARPSLAASIYTKSGVTFDPKQNFLWVLRRGGEFGVLSG
jgi:hypothetical protein